MSMQTTNQGPGRLPIVTLITPWRGAPPMTIEQGLIRLGALILGVLAVAQLRLLPAAGGLVTVAAAVLADRLRPPPTTGFLPLGWCPAGDVGRGDWIRDGRWAVRIVDRSLAPTGDPSAALRTWRLTLADGGQVDVAEDQRLPLLSPVRLRGGDRPQPVLEVGGEQAVSPRHARVLRRIRARQRDLGLSCLDDGRDGA
jgi:hypothetical protein